MQAKQLSMCLCKALRSPDTPQIFWNIFLRHSWLSAGRQRAAALGLQMHGLGGNS